MDKDYKLLFITENEVDDCSPPYDDPPDATRSIRQIITPLKSSKEYTIEGVDFDFALTLRKPIAVIDRITSSEDPPSLDESDETASSVTSKKGMKWDDSLRLEFLMLWIEKAEMPFYHWLHNNQGNKKKARETIEYMFRCVFSFSIIFLNN